MSAKSIGHARRFHHSSPVWHSSLGTGGPNWYSTHARRPSRPSGLLDERHDHAAAAPGGVRRQGILHCTGSHRIPTDCPGAAPPEGLSQSATRGALLHLPGSPFGRRGRSHVADRRSTQMGGSLRERRSIRGSGCRTRVVRRPGSANVRRAVPPRHGRRILERITADRPRIPSMGTSIKSSRRRSTS